MWVYDFQLPDGLVQDGAIGLAGTLDGGAPITQQQDDDGRRVFAAGEGRWHAPQPEGTFTYVELHLDDITYNVATLEGTNGRSPRALVDASP